ncbi:MAG: hypothetical protein OZSIB_3403 [Candidatus Ozemobacter sibiricus]|jgi:prepilin-type N-terminal cleavage/methylation domain-containing protein|uniref:Prepilin-type N-terminal cleavage/methylation domain-containing protein n=1 Tax=Candidatus Ozemobacter sibiricus TaxID=2268124 RepID=A0A367ZSA2_9BACT|nr:MAG: hypothetical protein OZSIB_3403 [Candidatus Ozemobacter sibiricus]
MPCPPWSRRPPARPGFTLIEILLSLLVMAGSIGLYFTGMQAAELLDRQARGEDRAARVAERELELLKNDLLAARRPPQGVARGRFRLPPGWQTRLRWAPLAEEGTVRLAARVTQRAGVDLQVESFLFLPSLTAPAALPKRGSR